MNHLFDKSILAKNAVSADEARASSLQFWRWCNSSDGHPEHYPDEEVVRFLGKAKKIGNRVLDLAFGSGKNTVAIADRGFETHGIDWSEPGLEYTNKRLQKFGHSASLKVADFSKGPLPYESGFFDAIVAIQVFDHLLQPENDQLLAEAHRILKPGGLMLASLMSTKTSRKTRTGIPVTGQDQCVVVSSGNSAGEIHRFFEYEQMESFLSQKFRILQSTLITITSDQTGDVAEAKYFILEK